MIDPRYRQQPMTVRQLVLFRVDGSDRIGGGHVIRCLNLADALRGNCDCLFVAAELTPFLRSRILAAGHELREIRPGLDFIHGITPQGVAASDDTQQTDAACCLNILGSRTPDWTIVDHYALDRTWEAIVAGFSKHLLVIDDLANRSHAGDVLVDQTLGRTPEQYRSLVDDGCRILAGSPYALLRKDFATARPASLSRRQDAPAERILVSLGTTDPRQLAAGIVQAILARVPDCTIDVVLGSAASSRVIVESLAQTGRVRLHLDVTDMVPLLAAADLAVGAAGGSAWERCCLGLPTVMLVLADNQRLVADSLKEAGAARLATSASDAAAALLPLIQNRDARLAMTAAAAAIVDGMGIERVADIILDRCSNVGVPLSIRPATDDDAQTAWLWRNDPHTRAVSQSGDIVRWSDHLTWWRRRLVAPDCLLLVAEHGDEMVAVTRYDRMTASDATFEVSINLAPAARGRGLGRQILAAGIADVERRYGAARFEAVILATNLASRRIFAKEGFDLAGMLGTTGFARYVRPARR